MLVLAPMKIEEAALNTKSRVLRTGMGPARARIAAARARAIDASSIAIAGLCGGLDPSLRPGDVVCANELRFEDGSSVAVEGSEQLAETLRRHGLRARVGPIVSTDRIMKPEERARLNGGAIAVDMESAWLAAAADGRPLAVVRGVVDPAGRRLTDPRIAIDGVRALRSLRRAGEVLSEWGE